MRSRHIIEIARARRELSDVSKAAIERFRRDYRRNLVRLAQQGPRPTQTGGTK